MPKSKSEKKSEKKSVPAVSEFPVNSVRAYIRARLLAGHSNADIVKALCAMRPNGPDALVASVCTSAPDKARSHVNFYVRQLRESGQLKRDSFRNPEHRPGK